MTVSKEGILAYCASGVAFHMIASAFNFYYVKVYINFYHIEESWFQIAQVLHLVWNAVSNPLFAYVQDSTKYRIAKTRRKSILYCGPLFSLSFLIPWIPWGDKDWIVGVHLIVALFIWDTMFTFIGLALSSLFTELSQNIEDRVALTRYAQLASVLGGPSVLLLEFTSDSLSNFRSFQATSVLIALISLLLFIYSGRNAHTKYDLKREKKDDAVTKVAEDESYRKQVWQILCDKNFIAFIITNFCHGFHKTFLNSFIAIICDQLVSDEDVTKATRKTFYGGISVMSTIMIIFGASLVTRYSYYRVIRSAFIYMIVAGIIMLHIGPGHPWCLMLFLLADKYPISSTVFGTSALMSKPALSLSPMFTVAILNSYGYSELTDKTKEASSELKYIMFILVCFFPIVIGTIQFMSWSFFSIQHKSERVNTI